MGTHQQGTKEACMAWPKLTKNANFGPNLVVFGQKILFFTGEIKSFVTYITENPPRPLFTLFFGQHWTICAKNGNIWPKMTKNADFGPNLAVFWSGIRSNGPKMLIFGPKCQFWAKFGRFWAPNPIFWGQGVKILVPSYRDSNETPFLC